MDTHPLFQGPLPAPPVQRPIPSTDRVTLWAFYFYMGSVILAVLYFILLPFFL